MIERLIDDHALGSGRAPQVIAIAITLTDGHAKVFQDREPAEKLVDLEGARESTPRTVSLTQRGDVLAVEQHATGMRFENAGDQVYQRGLAGSVGPNQCAARTPFEGQ